MEIKINSLFIVLGLCAIIASVTAITRKSYGEGCNKIHKCDRTAWLSCRDSKCECSKPDEMLYDEVKKSCVTKSGERCKYGLDESEESSLVEITDCVPNANCSSDGVCLCDSKYHEIYDGTCALSLSHGENCSEVDQCSKYAGLFCVDSKCQCKEGIYSEDKGLCVGVSQNDCIRGECVDGAVCVEGKCLCGPEYFHSAQKTCLMKKSINQNCGGDVECLRTDLLNLQCISGSCSCPEKFKYSVVQKCENKMDYNYPYEYYPEFTGPSVEMCAPIIGEECPSGYCMEGAFCEAVHTYTSPIYQSCKCEALLTPNKDSQYCAKTYQESCSTDTDCIDDLVCSENECNCPSPSHQFFDLSTRTCVTKVGGHCTNSSTCVEYSECQFLSSANISGHCRCQNDFVVNKDGKCDRSFGTDCGETLPKCDSAAGLICVNNTCSCPDTMYEYNSKFRKCLGLVGAYCNKSEERIICADESNHLEKSEHLRNSNICNITLQSQLTCIVNAFCNKKHSILPPECECGDGYEETDNHTCSAASSKTTQAALRDNYYSVIASIIIP